MFGQTVANFTVSHTSACVGDTITMTSTSTSSSNIVNYIWSAQGAIVESGSGPNLTSFKFVYSTPGTFNLSLIVQDANGVSSNKIINDAITINAIPDAIISSSILTCNSPFEVNFNSEGSSSGANISYFWTFPQGSPGSFNGAQKTVTYANEGTITATLTVMNTLTSCKRIINKTVILQNFIADFEPVSSFCKGSSKTLINTSSSNASYFVWTSTGGIFNNSNAENPSIVFNIPGNYTITLNASNSAGCSDTYIQNVIVHELPQVSFSYDENNGCAPKNIQFTNTSPNQNIQYEWNFDDNSPIYNGFNPPIHNYSQNGLLYFPTLTATDNNGCVNSFVSDTLYFLNPIANYKFNPSSGCEPVTVNFIDQSFSFENIVSWLWNFDDGTTSTLQNPNHTFYCGTYNVSLTIVDENNCVSTANFENRIMSLVDGFTTSVPDLFYLQANHSTQTISMFQQDVSGNNYQYDQLSIGTEVDFDFSISDKVVCADEDVVLTPIVFTSCFEEEDAQYIWDIEGYGISTFDNPELTINLHDTLETNTPMDASLTINFRSCLSGPKIKVDSIFIKGPVANFMIEELICNQGSGPHLVEVNDINSIYGHTNEVFFDNQWVVTNQANDDVEVSYDWGDGTQTVITDDNLLEDADKGAVSHSYTGYGTYVVTQRITNLTTGCDNEHINNVYISSLSVDLLTDTVCQFQDYKLESSIVTQNDFYPVFYVISNGTQQYFGDVFSSNTLSLPTPANQFFYASNSGTETITILVSNSTGCTDTITKTLHTLSLPEAVISVNEDTVCLNEYAILNSTMSIFGDFTNSWGNSYWYTQDTVLINTTQFNENFNYQVTSPIVLSLVVSDGFGCKSNNVEKITLYPQTVLANFTSDTLLCNEELEVFDASTTQGIGTLNYSWYIDNQFINSSDNPIFSNSITVTPSTDLFKDYSLQLTVIDEKGCSDTITRLIHVSNPRIISVDTSVFATHVDINGNFTCPPVVVDFNANFLSNYEPESFNWSFGNDFDNDFDSQNESPVGIQYVQAGNYNLYLEMVESVSGCHFSFEKEPFLFIGGPTAEALITSDTNDLCGMNYLFQIINPSNNLDRWDWELGDGTIIHSEQELDNSFIHTYLNQEDFKPILTLYDDSLQCAVPMYIDFELIKNGLEAYFEMNPSEAVVDLNMTFIDNSTSSNASIVEWIWNFGDGDSINSINDNPVSHIFNDETSKWVTLTIVDENGCTDQYSLPIELFTVQIMFPNIITNPGSSGNNSLFTLFSDIFTSFQIIVVNRWGNVVYEGEKDPNNPLLLWNGLNKNSNNPCVDGTYFYKIEGVLKNGKAFNHHDYLTISGSN